MSPTSYLRVVISVATLDMRILRYAKYVINIAYQNISDR